MHALRSKWQWGLVGCCQFRSVATKQAAMMVHKHWWKVFSWSICIHEWLRNKPNSARKARLKENHVHSSVTNWHKSCNRSISPERLKKRYIRMCIPVLMCLLNQNWGLAPAASTSQIYKIPSVVVMKLPPSAPNIGKTNFANCSTLLDLEGVFPWSWRRWLCRKKPQHAQSV